MKKAFLFLVVASVACVVGLALMAPEPTKAHAAASFTVPAIPRLDTAPVVLETGAELHIVPAKKEAPKARPVARKAQPKDGALVDCSNAKYRVREESGVLYCHN